ncbi:MAG: large-conductance mechanosensitive channel protein MscL [Gammaproteobacteria bacterium]
MSILKEFREFAMRGNVIDLAVGVVIGAAFGKIVSSLVGDVMMPVLGKAVGSVSFNQLGTSLGVGPDGSEIILKWGAFLQTLFDFTVIAMALFLAIKAINRLKRPEAEAPAAALAAPPTAAPPPRSEVLLEEIRDLLKTR